MGPVPAPKKALLYAIPPVTQKEADNLNKNFFHQSTFVLTSSSCITQLLTDHSGINSAPTIITHCPPLVVDAYFHSTFILIGASHQTNITISTVSTGIYCKQWLQFYCHQDLIFGSNKLVKYTTLLQYLVSFSQTLTSYSCIWVDRRTADSRASRAVSEVSLSASALNFIEVHCASARASAKVRIKEGYCICWRGKKFDWKAILPGVKPKWKLIKTTIAVEKIA